MVSRKLVQEQPGSRFSALHSSFFPLFCIDIPHFFPSLKMRENKTGKCFKENYAFGCSASANGGLACRCTKQPNFLLSSTRAEVKRWTF